MKLEIKKDEPLSMPELVEEYANRVIELENKVKRAVIMAQDKKIKPSDLSLPTPAGETPSHKTLQETREETEKACILDSLVRNNWNISRVSRELGTSRTTLYDLIEKYGLKK